ncbi:hypothetical protein NHP190020_18310 (plasmid) [Helicobacter suis]|uniref:Uncharacterized protein n=2 Tax=Helicobacter suis TaxID=104628 RepID=A0ABM7L1U0_9HELI|nr:hypothetical protein [Helicobacter suis]BCD46792.1 hypothetical protein NHP190020_18310 [Helicobacter suis]BCD52058.1 hypothetical protein NHP194022_17290 [Helicobacter suis]
MNLSLSICHDNTQYALNQWQVIYNIESLEKLAELALKYDTSPMIFCADKERQKYAKSQRSHANVIGFNNALFFDIDNQENEPYLSVQEAQKILKKHQIFSVIIPSRNYLKIKPKDTRKNIERYRIIIPTQMPISNFFFQEKEAYQILQISIAKALKIYDFVDKSALKDLARFYRKNDPNSPTLLKPIIIEGNRIMNLEFLEQNAIQKFQETREKKIVLQVPRQPVKEVRDKDLKSRGYLTHADMEKILSTDILLLISIFEGIEREYYEGSYHMVKTNKGGKYSLLEDRKVAHDFKTDATFNCLSYLEFQLQTTNLNKIARELEHITGESYIVLNPEVFGVVCHAINEFKNIIKVEQFLKNFYGVKFVKISLEGWVKIADQYIQLLAHSLDIFKSPNTAPQQHPKVSYNQGKKNHPNKEKKMSHTKEQILEILSAIETCEEELYDKEKEVKQLRAKLKGLKVKLQGAINKIGKSKNTTPKKHKTHTNPHTENQPSQN